MDADSIRWKPIALAEKTWPMMNADCPHVIHRANKGANTMGVKHDASYRSGENMAKKTDEELYDVAINMIGSVAKLPVIRVDREAFLRQQFADLEYLDEILEHGPQHVYTVESLRRKADGVIKKSTNQTTLAAFVAGIPGGPAAVAAGGADAAQYFGFLRSTWRRKSPISSERMICSPTSRN